MALMEESTVDIVIALQTAISQLNEVHTLGELLRSITGAYPIERSFILKLLLHSLPSLQCNSPLISQVESFLNSDNTNVEIVDIHTIFNEEVPKIIQHCTSLETEEKKSICDSIIESVNINAISYEFDDLQQPFESFFKSLVYRLNSEFRRFELTDELLNCIKDSKSSSLNLLNWIDGFYEPLKRLNSIIDTSYTLLDYEKLHSVDENIQLMTAEIEKGHDNNIIREILIPYFAYIGPDAWESFNTWLMRFGLKISSEKDTNAAKYNVLRNLLDNDDLLRHLDKQASAVKVKFTKYILSTIFLSPDTNLEFFLVSKEILVLLNSLKLEDGEPFDITSINTKSFQDVSRCFEASHAAISSLIGVIEVGEILYSNKLSLIDIVKLESSEKTIQKEQLIKYISTEIGYDTKYGKCQLFLSSIYSTLRKTNVFNKISNEELNEVILQKMLEMKQFQIISQVFGKECTQLENEKFNNLVLKQCWALYNNASNCDPKIGSLRECVECLQLLDENLSKVKRLNALIKANERIFEWKFYFEPKVPITPKRVLQCNNPLLIIRRILELNDDAYLYAGDLYYLVILLIDGFDVVEQSPLFKHKHKSFDDESNLLVYKIKLLCLEVASVLDYNYSFQTAFALVSNASLYKFEIEGLFDLVSENWFTFFQLSKNEYEGISDLKALNDKLKLLGQVLLIAPTEYNSNVLEQWQMLRSHKSQLIQSQELEIQSKLRHKNVNLSLGDVQSRLQKSLKSSADELLNTNGTEIGKSIVGWIVGAN